MAAFKVQSASNTSLIASVTATFANAPQAGNLLVAAVTANVASGSVTITGFTSAVSQAVGIAGSVQIFYKVSVGTETAITASGTLATLMDLHTFEYDGINNASPLDLTASTADSGAGVTSRASGTTATLTQANELGFAAVATAANNGGGVSWTNSFTTEITTTDLMTADIVVNATTALSSTASWTTSQRAAGLIVTFFGETGRSFTQFELKPRIPIINWNHPITKGLVFDAPLFEGGGSGSTTQEIITKQKASLSGAASKLSIFGNSVQFRGDTVNSDTINFTTLANQNNLNLISTEALFFASGFGGGTTGQLYRKGANSGRRISQEFDSAFSTSMRIGVSFSGSFAVWDTTFFLLNTWFHVFLTYDSSSTSNDPIVWSNGVKQSVSRTVAPVGSIVADTANMYIGNASSGVLAFQGQIALVRYWNRILSDSEVKQLYSNPWQIYKQPGIVYPS